MRKRFLFLIASVLCTASLVAQSPEMKRNIIYVDEASLKARLISVRFTEGLKAFYTNNLSEALQIFNGIVLDNPKHDASYFMISKVNALQHNDMDAVQALQQALKIDKSNVWYKVDLAELYMQMESYAQAAKLWEQICKEKDNNEYYLNALSQAYVGMGKLDKVIDVYNRMEKLLGHFDDITNAKVSVWLYQNKVNDAVSEYDKLIKLYPHNPDYYVKAGDILKSNNMMGKAMVYYKKAAEMNSDNPALNLTMADYYKSMGDEATANQYIVKVISNPSFDYEDKVKYMFSIFTTTVRQPNPENVKYAESLADMLLTAHPEEASANYFKAALLALQKKYSESKAFYEKSLQIDNSQFSIWDEYCYVLNQLDRWDELLKFEEELVTLFPTNAIMLTNLGLGHLYAKHADKSIEYLKQALSFSYEKSQKKIIYSALSEAFLLKGDSESAEQWKQKALKL